MKRRVTIGNMADWNRGCVTVDLSKYDPDGPDSSRVVVDLSDYDPNGPDSERDAQRRRKRPRKGD